VLARVDAVPGVERSRVDSSGRFFWVTPRSGADEDAVAAAVRGVLGQGARLLSPEEAGAQLAARGGGDPWLAADEVMTLSFVEARLLSVRISGEAAIRASLDPGQREFVAEAVRAALFGAMARVHAEGGRRSSGWIHDEWPALAAAAAARCAGAMPEDAAGRLAAVLPSLLPRSG
jgi:hypothetical protein